MTTMLSAMIVSSARAYWWGVCFRCFPLSKCDTRLQWVKTFSQVGWLLGLLDMQGRQKISI